MANVFLRPSPRIFHSIPWNSNKNIGKSYNETMELVNSDDWVCFLDGDAVHSTHFFGSRIEETVMLNPEYSLFTCYTNRVNCKYQVPNNVDSITNDQSYHRSFGEKMWFDYGTNVIDITNNVELSGVLILLQKSAWERAGGFKEEKMLSIDNDIHRKIRHLGERVGLMQGIYVQHWYRGGDNTNKSHLL